MSAQPDLGVGDYERAPDCAYDEAKANGHDVQAAVTVADFHAYLPAHTYIFAPTRELWPAASVNTRCESPRNSDGSTATKKVRQRKKDGASEWNEVAMSASEWLDKNHPVEQMTWAPGLSMIIADKLVSDGGWIERPGCNTFNLYRPPVLVPGDHDQASPWIDHVHRIYPDSALHLIRWLAHRVQRPGEKINHGLVLGGNQGTGKDTLLEPVKHAVGPWNFVEASPTHLLGRFNGFLKSVILRVSEARDLGDVDRYSFYDHTKNLMAAPPDVLRCDEKNIREHAVMNVTGVIVTSNHKQDGIYLPADDRRHYVAWSALTKDDFNEAYWRGIWNWYRTGGISHVGAYLATLDLSDFDPKAPPQKTAAWHEIVDANRAPEDAELADVLDALENPAAVTLGSIITYAPDSFREWLQDRRNSRQIPHRLEAAGYIRVRNDADRHDGHWKVGGKRQAIYARQELSVRDRITAATTLCRNDRL